MRKPVIVGATCALLLGCALNHERTSRAAEESGLLGDEIDTGLSLDSDDAYATFSAVAWPAPDARDRLLVAWGEIRYRDPAVRRVHLAEVGLGDGSHRTLASFGVEGNEAIHPQLAVAGDVPVLSWEEPESVHVVIDPSADPMHVRVDTPERRSQHTLAASRSAILVGWAMAGTPTAIPMLSILDPDGTARPDRVLAEWSDESYLVYGGRAVSVATSPAGWGAAWWVRHPPHDTIVDVLPLDEHGEPAGPAIAIDADNAVAGGVRVAVEADAASALVSMSMWIEDGVETQLARVALDGSGDLAMGTSMIPNGLGALDSFGEAAPLAAGVRVDDLTDPEYIGCALPPVIRSELWLSLIDGAALGSQGEQLVAMDEPTEDTDRWTGASLIRSPRVVSTGGGFAILWSEAGTLRYRTATP